MLLAHTDYKSYLNELLADKSGKNPKFSLRSFARQLAISPSGLSRILNGNRKITTKLAAQISMQLDHNEEESVHFFDLVLLDTTRNDQLKQKIMDRIEQRCSIHTPKSLTLESFRVISDCYHYALLALIKSKGFKSDPKWIASRLGISKGEAKLALERLLKLELIKETNKGYEVLNNANITTTHDISSLALKNHHKQLLTRALESIDTQEVNKRDITGITLTFNPGDLPKVKEVIKKFRRKVNTDFDTPNGQEVYQLNIQFFKLSKEEK